jgi:CheY-like chemotaxis protein
MRADARFAQQAQCGSGHTSQTTSASHPAKSPTLKAMSAVTSGDRASGGPARSPPTRASGEWHMPCSPAQPMKTVLVVDDDLAIRELLSDALAEAGYRVLAVGNGRRAFEITKQERPDVVLADLMLPDLSGRELIRRIRGNEEVASTPVITMSAALPSDAPGTAFLAKPFDVEDVLRIVQLTLSAQAAAAAEASASRSENLPR